MSRWPKIILFALLLGLLANFIIFFTSIPDFLSHSLGVLTCTSRGGEVVSANKLGGSIVHHPRKVCAYSFSDAGKPCTDSSQCQGACLVQDKLTFEIDNTNVDNATGECQQYKKMDLNCFIEIDDGKYVPHEPCLVE